MPAKPKNISGQRFGRLVATEMQPGPEKSGSPRRWLCVCDCGKTKIVSGGSLRRGMTKSCGCIVQEAAWDHPRTHPNPIESAWDYNWKQYQRNAKFRRQSMTLSYEEFKSLCSQPCFYCGAVPERRPSQRSRSSLLASGLDRVDNALGYEKGNVVPCCTWCNRAKNNMTKDEFIRRCVAVAETQKEKPNA